MKENKRYLKCKYLDAGMDGMLCSKNLCTTCKEFNGEKCSNFISKNRYIEANKKMLEVDTIEKAELIANLLDGNQKRMEVQIPKFNPDVWKKDTKLEKQIEEMSVDKEMIEEMKQDLIKIRTNLRGCYLPQCFGAYENAMAQDLIDLNYRKIPDGSVVLTEMQYNALLSKQSTVISIDEQLKKEFEYELKQARKKTAKEILNKIMSVETEEEKWLKNEPFVRYVKKMLDKIEELAKQFGVEIKE